MPNHIYLSPHLDDAVFSCGGLIFQQASRGEEVLVLTICAGDPPLEGLSDYAHELHERWEEGESPVASRRTEDQNACLVLGAGYEHLEVQDAIYRVSSGGKHLYPSMAATFGEVDEEEFDLVERITARIAALIQGRTNLYVPTCFGGHIDHRLTRMAAEGLEVPLQYFRDLPYAGRGMPLPEEMENPQGEEIIHPTSPNEATVWVRAMLEYKSQLSTFWEDDASVTSEVNYLLKQWGGIPILRSKP